MARRYPRRRQRLDTTRGTLSDRRDVDMGLLITWWSTPLGVDLLAVDTGMSTTRSSTRLPHGQFYLFIYYYVHGLFFNFFVLFCN
uniref:Uncharacterized protein n=1 Tax=Arundo donax TaxID=35708 RepID=A0A0A8XZ81_ARUDO